MSSDSQPKRLSVARNYRQRFQGAAGEYIYRKTMRVLGADGQNRRVLRGDPVDIEGDNISPRRLKALWYAEAIELANFDVMKERAKLPKTMTDNAAVRREDADRRAKEDAQIAAKRDERRKINALRREAEEQRRLAAKAIEAAEAQERREIEQMIAEEERAKLEAEIERRLASMAEKQAEQAEKEREQAEEAARVAQEREQLARERQAQAAADAAEERELRDLETDEREAARVAAREQHLVHNDQREPAERERNPNTVQVDAGEQRERIFGNRGEE